MFKYLILFAQRLSIYNPISTAVCLLAVLGLQTPAFSQTLQDRADTKLIANLPAINLTQNNLSQSTNAAMCAQCHGTNGVSDPSSLISSLAGMPRQEFIQKMQDFKLASPTSSVMARLAKGLFEEQINSAAIFFENQTKPPVSKNQN